MAKKKNMPHPFNTKISIKPSIKIKKSSIAYIRPINSLIIDNRIR